MPLQMGVIQVAPPERMRDAAFAKNIPADWKGAVGGYLNKYEGAGDPFHPWTPEDWQRFKNNRKLPIFVQSFPDAAKAEDDAADVLKMLYDLAVPLGARTALDMETAVNVDYVKKYGRFLRWFGYRTWVYGSASTVFGNPALDGYWVADYTGQPFEYDHKEVRSTQYTDNPPADLYDSSTIKAWVYDDLRHWWI